MIHFYGVNSPRVKLFVYALPRNRLAQINDIHDLRVTFQNLPATCTEARGMLNALHPLEKTQFVHAALERIRLMNVHGDKLSSDALVEIDV